MLRKSWVNMENVCYGHICFLGSNSFIKLPGEGYSVRNVLKHKVIVATKERITVIEGGKELRDTYIGEEGDFSFEF